MADRIRLLPEVVANQIAAGEVVNRPSSVVKEMVENALDAGARSVKVNYHDGGRDLIQIVDDGCGMSPMDARMAFDRHATSKISTVEDIYALHTFGFRGEALASIAAVAQVELKTRQEGDEIGTQTEINGGQFVSQKPMMCPVGSQFCVRNLFYNVPARRRFLDKSTTSATQIKTEFQRVALCNPQVAFALYANDAAVYDLKAASLAGRIVDVVGRHIKQNLLEIGADTTIGSLRGYIGRPAAAKRRNTEQFLFVNGRYFRSNYLTSAILKAYEKLIPENAQPSYFLYLTIDPSRIDVNVHPQKTEVKFADEAALWQIVNAAVRETLAKTGAVPPMDFDPDTVVDIPVMQQGVVYKEPQAMSDGDYNPFRESYIDPSAPDPNIDFTGFDVPYKDTPTTAKRAATTPSRGYRGGAGGSIQPNEEFEDIPSEADDAVEEVPSMAFDSSHLDFIPSSSEATQQRMEVGESVEFSDVMSIGNGYLVALFGGRLVVVDIRRAKERIAYENYRRMLGNGQAVSEQLLFPERIELSTEEYASLEEHAVEFASLGFDLDLCGAGVVEVRGTPADLPADQVDRMIYELLQAFASPVTLQEVRREKIAVVMAVASARLAPRNMTREEAEVLLHQLTASGNVSFSPTGKAVMAEISADDLRAKLG